MNFYQYSLGFEKLSHILVYIKQKERATQIGIKKFSKITFV